MKLLNEKQRRHEARRSRHGIVKRRSRRLLLAIRNERERIRDTETIYAPLHIVYNVHSNRDRRVIESFMQSIDECLRRRMTVFIDFSRTQKLYPCGVLVLMGLVDDWIERFPGKLKAIYPSVDLVEQMLQQIGVLAKLGLEPRKTINHNDVIKWDYFTGMNVDASEIGPFMERVRALIGEEKQLGLADCVNEAMTNVKHHAYGNSQDNRWWIFATTAKNNIFLAIHDRGESIPATLLTKPTLTDFLSGAKWSDNRLITSAVGGRTSTELPHRGKGLPEMLAFTLASGQSMLAIYSRNGFFRYNGIEQHESHGKLAVTLPGTLIIWTIALPKEKYDEKD